MPFFSNVASAVEAVEVIALSAMMMIVCHVLAHGLHALFRSTGSDPHSVSALRPSQTAAMEGLNGAAGPRQDA